MTCTHVTTAPRIRCSADNTKTKASENKSLDCGTQYFSEELVVLERTELVFPSNSCLESTPYPLPTRYFPSQRSRERLTSPFTYLRVVFCDVGHHLIPNRGEYRPIQSDQDLLVGLFVHSFSLSPFRLNDRSHT